MCHIFVVKLIIDLEPMLKAHAVGGFLPLITSQVQELPPSLVISLVAANLMLTTLLTALWLNCSQPSLIQGAATSQLGSSGLAS